MNERSSDDAPGSSGSESIPGNEGVRLQAEEVTAALRDGEKRLRTLADALPQIIWTNDAAGTANYFNRRWFEYSGLSYAESYRLGWQAIVHPEDAAASLERWERALAQGEVFDTEYRLRDAAGGYRWFIGRNVPARDGQGRVTGWFGTATDVQDLKYAQEALLVHEERHRVAQEAAELSTWDYDVPADRVAWNEQHYRAFGLPLEPGSKTSADFLRAIHPEDVAMVTARLREAVEESGVFRAEFRIIRADNGATRWMNGFGKAMEWHRGKVTRMSGVMADVTERRKANEVLAATQERLRLIVDSALEHAIISLDLERRVQSWNPGAQAIFGYAFEDIVGQSADLIFTPEDRAARVPEQEVRSALEDGRANDNRWLLRKDGSRFWANGAMVPMRTQPEGALTGLVKILRDETPAREAREALEMSRKELWEALQETERAREIAEAAQVKAEAAGQAKDHFLAVLSHELRTPLTPVLMAVRMLQRDQSLSPAARESLSMIERNVRLEARFIDDLLDLTRIERGKLEITRAPLRLHEVIQHAVEVALPDVQAKRQRVELALAATDDRLSGDFARLQQVFWNLLKNGSKFSPADTVIHIRSYNPPAAAGEASAIAVEVTDAGIGFEAAAGQSIFDAFTQASREITREFGGLGLGLSISQAIIRAHGGVIRASSPGRDRGATFSVQLARREDETSPA